MKEKVYKILKRLYPNATGFGYYKTKCRTIYFVDNKDGNREIITDTFRKVCLAVTCEMLFELFNKTC